MLELELKLNTKEDKEYKVKAIENSILYDNEVVRSQLLGLYYLVHWKSYSKDESSWETVLIIMHSWIMINTFHENYYEKFIAIFLPLNSALPMAKSRIKPLTKQKYGRLTKDSVKQDRKVTSNLIITRLLISLLFA